MMDLHVTGKNIPVTDALFDHAERKLQKLTRFLPPWDEPPHVELELSVERNPSIERNQVAEVTVRTKGPVLRVRESDRDMYLAIDHAVQKLQGLPDDLPLVAEEPEPQLVKTKRFEMKPMGLEEAVIAFEMVSHDFYVFRNDDDGGAVNVLYRRRDGDLGLIAPG
jgi:putative sigma-54 modulation protein